MDAKADAAHVRCPSCGAPCRAADAEVVACAHCKADVPVPEEVRLFVRWTAVVRGSRDLEADRDAQVAAVVEGAPVPEHAPHVEPLDLPKVEHDCARCGHPLSYADLKVERCPACGTETTSRLPETALLTVRGIEETMRRREQRRQAILREFPIAKRIDDETWDCGGCGARLRLPPPESTGRSFEPCDGCGKENQVFEGMSIAMMYRRIGAGLSEAEIREKMAELEAERRQIYRGMGAAAGQAGVAFGKLIAFAIVSSMIVAPLLVFALRATGWEPATPKIPTRPFAPIDMPRFTTVPSVEPGECARVGEGTCTDEYTLRRCSDAGVVEEDHCLLLSMRCCTGPARCCVQTWDAGGE